MHGIHRSFGCAMTALAFALSAISGCGSEEPGKGSTDAEAPAAPLSAGQIVEILATIDRGVVRQSEVALDRVKNDDVKALAQRMLAAHQGMEQGTTMLLGKMALDSEDSPIAADFRKQSAEIVALLQRSSDERIDLDYLDAVIAVHQRALTAIDAHIMPVVESPDLRAFLEQRRAELAKYLGQALVVRRRYPPDPGATIRP